MPMKADVFLYRGSAVSSYEARNRFEKENNCVQQKLCIIFQAVMELGASVCTIHQPPSCGTCPIQTHCSAYQRQRRKECNDSGEPLRVTDYPVKVVFPLEPF